MATFKRGRKFTDDEVESFAEGKYDDDEIVIVHDAVENFDRCATIADHLDVFDVNLWDTSYVIYDVELA